MRLIVSPERARIDELVSIGAEGLGPGRPLTLRAGMQGYAGGVWASEATFAADAEGRVDLGRDAPISGAYDSVDAMGLFWSMRREPRRDVPFAPREPLIVLLTGEVDGKVIAEATAERLPIDDGVSGTIVRERGLVGTLFRPDRPGPHPGVVVVGGSGGGQSVSFWQAAQLAGHGFAALALAYFAAEGLPSRLVSIPLEYFETAFDWLAAQPDVAADEIGVVGTSRGGEPALLLGATFPRVRAVVAYVPSHVVWGGLGSGTGTGTPSWTLDGEPLPIMRRWRRPESWPPAPEPPADVPFALTPGFLMSLADWEAEERALIPSSGSTARSY